MATFIVDRNLHPLSETAVIKGGSDAESPAATGGHRLIVCTQQQVKVSVYILRDLCVLVGANTQDQLARLCSALPSFLS